LNLFDSLTLAQASFTFIQSLSLVSTGLGKLDKEFVRQELLPVIIINIATTI